MNIAIVGAGPVGSYTASLLAQKGFKVQLFDQKKIFQIGAPVQCTGIFPAEIRKFIPLKNKKFFINSFTQAQVFSPNKKQVTFQKKEYLVDRHQFDQYLIHQAIQQGASFHPQHKLIKIERNNKNKTNLIFKNNHTLKIFTPDIIIAADGPLSLIYQYLNKNNQRKFYYGIQATIKGSFNPTVHQTFFGKKIAPHFFAWLVPESNTRARLGLAVLRKPHHYFQNLLHQLNIKPTQILKQQAGIIPLFNPHTKFHKKNIFLLGDAAGHVKATTGGGIIPSFQEAHNLVKSIKNNQFYKPQITKLKHHLYIRKILNNFSDSDYNTLFTLLSKPKNKSLINKYSRENPKKLIQKIIFQEPSLLLFIKKLFKFR